MIAFNRKYVFSIFFALSCLVVNAQGGGLNVYGGYSAGFNSYEPWSNNGGVRGGYHLGADARILGDDMYFLIGGRYTRLAVNDDSFPAISSDSYNLGTLRIGLGFTLAHLSQKVKLKSLLVGSLHFQGLVNSSLVRNPGFDIYNDSFLGATKGIGVNIGALTLMVEYEYGLVNAIQFVAETKLSFITVSAGVWF